MQAKEGHRMGGVCTKESSLPKFLEGEENESAMDYHKIIAEKQS